MVFSVPKINFKISPSLGLKKGSKGDLQSKSKISSNFAINSYVGDKLPVDFEQEFEKGVSFSEVSNKKKVDCKIFITRENVSALTKQIRKKYDLITNDFIKANTKAKEQAKEKEKELTELTDALAASIDGKGAEKENVALYNTVKSILLDPANVEKAKKIFTDEARKLILDAANTTLIQRNNPMDLSPSIAVQILVDKKNKDEPSNAEIKKLIPTKKSIVITYATGIGSEVKEVEVPLINLCVVPKVLESEKENARLMAEKLKKQAEEEASSGIDKVGNVFEGGRRKHYGGNMDYPTKKKISSEFSISTSSLCE